MSARPADWTNGEEAILYQSCAACGGVQYFRRGFCAACGAGDLREKRASGEGIVLVDAEEGFRMMAHGDNALAIGDRVRARFAPFAGRIVPYFEKTK